MTSARRWRDLTSARRPSLLADSADKQINFRSLICLSAESGLDGAESASC